MKYIRPEWNCQNSKSPSILILLGRGWGRGMGSDEGQRNKRCCWNCLHITFYFFFAFYILEEYWTVRLRFIYYNQENCYKVYHLVEISSKFSENYSWQLQWFKANCPVAFMSYWRYFLPTHTSSLLIISRHRHKIAAFIQITFWNTISCMNIVVFSFKFHQKLIQQQARIRSDNGLASNRCIAIMNQCWPSLLTHICHSTLMYIYMYMYIYTHAHMRQ